MMTKKQLPTFTQWLAGMVRNQSAIGDLARDVAQDKNFPAQGERIVYIDYLTAINASAGAISAFNRAWANYQTALKRAQETGAGSSSASPAQAETERKPETVAPYHEWTDEEVRDHDKWYAAQGEPVAVPGGDRGQNTELAATLLQGIDDDMQARIEQGESVYKAQFHALYERQLKHTALSLEWRWLQQRVEGAYHTLLQAERSEQTAQASKYHDCSGCRDGWCNVDGVQCVPDTSLMFAQGELIESE